MIITNLYLRDFRSFREASVDLSAFRAATVVGRNGAGKSTLIVDAPLWALFGETRGAGADSVVRIGATDCLVSVDFEAGGELYRVTRKRSTRGAGKSEVEFYRIDAGRLTPLSGKSIAETQAAIDRAVGVSLDTLVAASVVKQGDAARFSSATPEKRREVLRAILGLDAYKALAQAARERGRAAQSSADALTRQVERAGDVAGRLAGAEEAHAWAMGVETSAAERLTRADADEHAARVAVAQAQGAVDAEAQRLAGRDELERKVVEARWAHGAAVGRLQTAQAEAQGIDAARQAERRIPGAEAEVGEARAALERCNEARRRADAVQRAAGEDPGVAELARWLAEARAEVDAVDPRAYVEARAARERAVAARQRTQDAVERAEQSAARLTDAPCAEAALWTPAGTYHGIDLRGTCPFIADARAAAERLPALREALESAIRAEAAADAALGAARDGARRRQDAEAWAAELQRKLDGRRREVQTLRARELSGAMDLEHVAGIDLREAERRLAALRQEAAALPAKLAALGRAQVAAEEVKTAAARIEEAQAALDACMPDPTLGWALDAAKAGAQKAADTAQHARKMHRDAVAAVERARAAVLALENERDRLRDLADEAAGHAESARAWARTQEALDLAAVLLMERAIPVIEAEANAVLARISTRGMRVRLDTQRQLKSRDGVRETLDIVIRDEVGERPYEDFSGGEQFRADMALRLGLARLLADREGVTVEMLVIDEGSFGALDPEGVASLKDVLQGLQGLYRLVLVVSHVPEVADCFEHRIEIEQGPDGSRVAGAGVDRRAA